MQNTLRRPERANRTATLLLLAACLVCYANGLTGNSSIRSSKASSSSICRRVGCSKLGDGVVAGVDMTQTSVLVGE